MRYDPNDRHLRRLRADTWEYPVRGAYHPDPSSRARRHEDDRLGDLFWTCCAVVGLICFALVLHFWAHHVVTLGGAR